MRYCYTTYMSKLLKEEPTNKAFEGDISKLTPKQRKFVAFLLSNPKASATKAALEAYGKHDKEISYNTARSIATENMAKPAILAVLRAADKEAESVLLSVMRSSEKLKTNPQHATVAERAANSILDRLHGKATQRVEQHTSVVSIGIDLTGTVEND